jgi:phosphoribosylaminoimidazolecarboxamide formyltransferase / IMP cyclohydrolase
MVVVNLYPFHEAVAAGSPLPLAMEKVDIGGPTMLRAAAKNHESVTVIVDPDDYGRVLDALRAGPDAAGNLDGLRRELAGKVFAHTARYDSAVAGYFRRAATEDSPGQAGLPPSITLELTAVQPLRYGENPDQQAAFYREPAPPPGSLPQLRQLHGKELSFNNLLDVDAAMLAISAWAEEAIAACVIVKHTTPCGVAVAATAVDAYRRAFNTDPVSAFGGIVAFNIEVDESAAREMGGTFLEIVVAPAFTDGALAVLRAKKNLRLIELPVQRAPTTELDYKCVRGGFLVQQRISMEFDEADWRVVTKRQPEAGELDDLRFAWRVAVSVKSNAIVLARNGRTLGIGAGQMSRVDSARIAVMKAHDQRAAITGGAMASDAFFPFRDGVDAAASAGVRCIIQPGGSMRDEEVIAAADEHRISMVFTGRRVFRH